jgi:formate/nitrite transporter FocA (FNT family)
LWNVARLWTIVFFANMVGALAIAWTIGNTGVFAPEVRNAFADIARESTSAGFGLIVLRGVFAGWLMAMLVWVLPFAETARFFVIVGITWLIALGGFAHVVAGAVDVLLLATTGATPWQHAIGGFIIPALVGNTAGGVALVAVINHAQVVS